jgi:hypothetical protein
MFCKSHKLGGLVGLIAVAVAALTFALPASAATAPCNPPVGVDGWYCAALALSNADAKKAVTDRLVDD